MLFARIAAVAAVASVLWSATAGAGGPLRPFRHGLWSGGAYTDDRSGAFTHCSAGVAYDSGIDLFVLVTAEYRWWVGLINPKWELTPNAKVSIKLQLDGGDSFNGLASIPSGQLLLVSLPDSSKLLEAFRRTSRLGLDAEGESFSFKLNGTPAVMEQLTSCVQTSVALAAQAPPSTAAAALSEPELKTGAVGAVNSSATPSPSRTPAMAASASAEAAPPAAPSQAPSAIPPETPSETPSAAGGAQPQTPGSPAATPSTVAGAQPTAISAEPASSSPGPPRKAGPAAAAGSPSLAAASTSSGFASTGGGAPAGAGTPPSVSTASATAGAPPEKAARPSAATAVPGGDSTSDPGRERSTAPVSSAAVRPAAPPDAEKPEAMSETKRPPYAAPPLAFTSVAPGTSLAPATAAAVELPRAPATATAMEEVRLATDFFTKARLPEARLVVADKPSALADFNAVWRSEDAAGAVKIIPSGPDVSGMGIASNLIAVDPTLCKGNFSAARFRTDVGNRVVFSAVLACSEENEQRVTEYFITPRHQGGFVVFAVILSNAAGQTPGFDWQKIGILSKAAIQAAEGQG